MKRAKPLVEGQLHHFGAACRSRLRSARKAAQALHRLLRRKSETKEQEQRAHYQKLIETAEHMVRQTQWVVRVLEGKQVASADKVLSLFEPHTRAIPRHKGGAEVEFGRQVILDEVDGGIVTRYAILEQPNEHGQALEAVTHHRQVFGRAPRLVAGDRGVHSPQTQEGLTAAGVKLVAIPASGKLSEKRLALERTRRFKRGYR